MSTFFHDTSALVNEIFAKPNSFHFVSRITLVELRSALALKLRTGALSSDAFHAARRRIQIDWSRHLFHSITLTRWHMRSAEILITKHGLAANLRTLDSIQLATAIEMQARGLRFQFVSADKNPCRIAAAELLAVINPEQP